MPDLPTLVPARVHLTYSEPHPDHGTWTSPPLCLPKATVDRTRDAITALAGVDARDRRTSTISPCDCSGEVGRSATDLDGAYPLSNGRDDLGGTS